MGVIDFSEALKSAIEAGQYIDGSTVKKIVADNGDEIADVVLKTVNGGNGTATSTGILVGLKSAVQQITTGGVAMLTLDLGVAGAAIAPCFGVIAGVGLYNIAPEFWDAVGNGLYEAGKTIGGKVVAYFDGNNLFFDKDTLEIFKNQLLESGILENSKVVTDPNALYNESLANVALNGFPSVSFSGALGSNAVIFYTATMNGGCFTNVKEISGGIICIPISTTPTTYTIETVVQQTGEAPVTNTQTVQVTTLQQTKAGNPYYTGNGVYISTQYQGSTPYLLDYNSMNLGDRDSVAGDSAEIIFYGSGQSNPNIQPDATLPDGQTEFPLTYPNWYPLNYPTGAPDEMPELYPVKYPYTDPDPYPKQDPAQQPDPESVPDTWPYIIPDFPLPDPFPFPEIPDFDIDIDYDPDPDPFEVPDPDPVDVVDPDDSEDDQDPDPDPTYPDPDPDPVDPNPDDPITPVIPDPVLPDTVSSNKLFTVYNPSMSQLNALGAYLWDGSLMETIKKIWQNPLDGIISLIQVYATPSTSGSANIILGYLDSGVSAPVVSSQFVTVEYNPLENYNMTEHEEIDGTTDNTTTHTGTVTTTRTGTDTTTHTGTDANAKTGTDTLTMTGTDANAKTGTDTVSMTGTDTNRKLGDEDTTHTGTDTTAKTGTETVSNAGTVQTDRDGTNENEVSAFNSSSYQDNVKDTIDTTDLETRNLEGSTTYNTQNQTTKNLTDATDIDITETETRNMTDQTTYANTETETRNMTDQTAYASTETETRNLTDLETRNMTDTDTHNTSEVLDGEHHNERELTRSGNIGVTTSQQMLQSEIELRKWVYYQSVFNDIDTILTLSIY